MSNIDASALLGAEADVYKIERSLRFNAPDSAFLSRAFTSDGGSTWTISCWLKRSEVDTRDFSFTLMHAGSYPNPYEMVQIGSNQIVYYNDGGASAQGGRRTAAVLRDCSAWYHIVCVRQGTSQFKIYVNGVEQAAASNTNPSASYALNKAATMYIGQNNNYDGGGTKYSAGYLTEYHFVSGQALTPSSFGETNPATGVWQPKRYTGTYGTNGFYLKFADTSAATATTLGKDSSGNGNNWTPNNFNVAITGSYASTWTGSATGSPSGVQDPLGAFLSNSPTIPDNSQAGGRRTYVNHSGGTSWLQFTPAAPIGGTTLRVFTYQPQGTSGADTWLNINGGADIRPWRVAANYTGWSTNITIPGGSLTSIKGSLSYGGASGMSIFAIEIDGVILRNSNEGIDSMIDTPTPYADGGNGRGNYCTLNPLTSGSFNTLSNGNLDVTGNTGTNNGNSRGTITFSTGKWYVEMLVSATATSSYPAIGIIPERDAQLPDNGGTKQVGYVADSVAYENNGQKRIANVTSSYGASYTTNDVIGVAIDADNGAIYFSKNGTYQNSGVPTSGASKTGAAFTWTGGSKEYVLATAQYNGSTASFNFGQRPFAYTPPSGFLALNTNSLPEPSIKKPNQYFDATLYQSIGASQTVVNAGGMQPDLVWVKDRTGANNHYWVDAQRGTGKALFSNLTNSESTDTNTISAFNSNGFSISGTSPNLNTSTDNYVAWQWKESATPGFDIVTFTGNGSAPATISHSLGVAPSMMIVKNRDQTGDFVVYHSSITNSQTGGIFLNLTNAWGVNSTYFNNSVPTSSNFQVGSYFTGNNIKYVAYLWSEVAGFSKFGSYTGNGSSDGPFVFCGFRPRWVLAKRSDASAYNWFIFDAARSLENVSDEWLLPNGSNAEQAQVVADMVSNGFKIRSSLSEFNINGGTYIFAAFAESPQKYSLAR